MRLPTLMTAILLPMMATTATAQGQFSPAITVNDSAISGYELDQRAKLLTLFRTPGNAVDLARDQPRTPCCELKAIRR